MLMKRQTKKNRKVTKSEFWALASVSTMQIAGAGGPTKLRTNAHHSWEMKATESALDQWDGQHVMERALLTLLPLRLETGCSGAIS